MNEGIFSRKNNSFVCFWGNELLTFPFSFLGYAIERVWSIVCYSEVKFYYHCFYNGRNLDDGISDFADTIDLQKTELKAGWNNKIRKHKDVKDSGLCAKKVIDFHQSGST